MENSALSRGTYVKINLNKIENNVQNIIRNYPDYDYYIGVVKSNAYGHGSFIVKEMISSGINYLAVSSLQEAINIRLFQTEIPILCLEPISLDYIDIAVKNHITITVTNLKYLKELLEICKEPMLKIHIKLNTGMNRLGFSSKEELNEAVRLICSNYILEGIFSHFATIGVSDPYWDRQLNRFIELTEDIDLKSIPIVHLGKSLTLINHPKIPFCNGIRIGGLLYGFNLSPKKDDSIRGKLRQLKANRRIKKYHISETTLECKANVDPVLSLYSVVIDIQNIKTGESTGYGVSYKASKDTKIAIVAIGYADGFSRKNSGNYVYINDKKYKIVGSVNMAMIQVEVDDNVHIGDEVEIYGDNIPVMSVSKYTGTIPHECTCAIHESIPRVYEKDGEIIHIESWMIK